MSQGNADVQLVPRLTIPTPLIEPLPSPRATYGSLNPWAPSAPNTCHCQDYLLGGLTNRSTSISRMNAPAFRAVIAHRLGIWPTWVRSFVKLPHDGFAHRAAIAQTADPGHRLHHLPSPHPSSRICAMIHQSSNCSVGLAHAYPLPIQVGKNWKTRAKTTDTTPNLPSYQITVSIVNLLLIV